jgi:uncharacterized protein with HEPN domain
MRSELAPLNDIVTAASRIIRFMHGVGQAGFLANDEKQSAVFGQIVIIGEAANRLPRDFMDAHANVPWRKMIGMRNRVVHGYDEIDWYIVWQVAAHEVPGLVPLLTPLLRRETNQP